MYPKLLAWFELRGRRLIELKIKGGMQVFKKKKDRDLSEFNLDYDELTEFFALAGQMDGILWALQPDNPDEATQFFHSVKEFLTMIEEECYAMKEMTGKTSLPKGRA